MRGSAMARLPIKHLIAGLLRGSAQVICNETAKGPSANGSYECSTRRIARTTGRGLNPTRIGHSADQNDLLRPVSSLCTTNSAQTCHRVLSD